MIRFERHGRFPKTGALARTFRDQFMQQLNKSFQDISKDFERTTETWDRKPAFKTSVNINANRIIFKHFTTSDIYKFVSRGTRVRYMKMTHNFVPKTTPGFIGSGPGAGGVFGRSPVPLPGIEARNFELLIATKHRRRVAFRLEIAMRNAARRSGHAFK